MRKSIIAGSILFLLACQTGGAFAQSNSTNSTALGFESLGYDAAFARLAVAAGLAGIIGMEREFNNYEHRSQGLAGIRTHMIVALAACQIQLVAVYGYAGVTGISGTRDPARLAAQVINGIGFLGAGAIWSSGSSVRRGLVTAGTLWMAAATGLASGVGYWAEVATAVCLVIALLTVVRLLTTYSTKFGNAHITINRVQSYLYCELLDFGTNNSAATATSTEENGDPKNLALSPRTRGTFNASTAVEEIIRDITDLLKEHGGAVSSVDYRREFVSADITRAHVRVSFPKLPEGTRCHMVVLEMDCLLDPNEVAPNVSDLLEKYPHIQTIRFSAKDRAGMEDPN